VNDQWYFRKSGETCGPVSRQELARLAQVGEIDSATLVWREGFSDWVSITALGAKSSAQAPPPPPPPRTPASAPSPRAANPPRSARRPPSDSTGWIVLGGVGLVMLLVAAVAIGWMARGFTSNSRGGLNVAAKAGSTGVQPATQSGRSKTQTQRATERRSPAPTKVSQATDVKVAPAPSTDIASPPAIAPSAKELPENTEAPAAPPNPAPSAPAPTADSTTAAPSTVSGESAPASKLETFFQEVDIQKNPTFAILGTESSQNIHYQLLSELRLGPPDERGIRKVDQIVKNARLISADDLSRGYYEESLRKIVGWQFSYRLNAGGEVLELTSSPADGRRAVRVEPKGLEGFLLTSVMDEAGWKELAQLSFFVPNQQARSNQPMVRQMTHDFGSLGSWSGTTSFRPQGTQKGIQRFDYVHDMTYKPPEKGAGDLPFAVADAKFVPDVAGGSIYFDAKKGRVQAAQERFQVRGEISADVLGQAAAIQVQEQQAISVRLFDQDPWIQDSGAAGSRRRMP